jgi:hypothetical protein
VFWFEQVSPQQALEGGRNPIVGDPDRIAKLATDLTGTADTLRTQNQRLRSVNSDTFWKGEAATAFNTFKEKLPPLLDKVIERYTKVGSALATYHPEIREAQLLATRALRDYQAAKGDQQIAQTNAQHKQMLQTQACNQHKDFVWNGPLPEQQLAQAQDRMQAAVREMTQAMQQRDQAAHTCSARVGHAIDDDLKNESWWKRALTSFGKWALDGLEKLAPVLRKVGGYLGIAALALGWVPVVGEILGAAALAVNAAALIADGVLYAAGHKVSASQILADVVGVLPLAKMAKAAGGLRALRNVQSLEDATQYLKTAAQAAGPELKAVFTKADAALETLSRSGASGVLAQTADKLAADGALRTVVGHVIDKRIEANAKDFIKDPTGKVSDLVRNPASILVPKLPSGDPAKPNVVVEGAASLAHDAVDWAARHPEVIRTIARISMPLAPVVP